MAGFSHSAASPSQISWASRAARPGLPQLCVQTLLLCAQVEGSQHPHQEQPQGKQAQKDTAEHPPKNRSFIFIPPEADSPP